MTKAAINDLLATMKQATGHTSAWECYDWLVRIQQQDTEVVKISKPARVVHVMGKAITVPEEIFYLNVRDVKELALMEVYSRVPDQDSLDKIVQCIGSHVSLHMEREAKEIIYKLPTK